MWSVHFLSDYVLACLYVCVRERQRKGWKKGGKEREKEREKRGQILFAEKMEKED